MLVEELIEKLRQLDPKSVALVKVRTDDACLVTRAEPHVRASGPIVIIEAGGIWLQKKRR